MTDEQLPVQQPLPVPEGPNDAGAALWAEVTGAYLLDPGERAVLIAACRVCDTLAELEDQIQVVGAWDRDKKRINPVVREHRQQAGVLARLIAQLQPPAEKAKGEPRRYGYWARRGPLSPA